AQDEEEENQESAHEILVRSCVHAPPCGGARWRDGPPLGKPATGALIGAPASVPSTAGIGPPRAREDGHPGPRTPSPCASGGTHGAESGGRESAGTTPRVGRPRRGRADPGS